MDLKDDVDQLLKARSEIDEELRRHQTKLTVLFTDVVGSTTYFDQFGDTAGLLLLHRHDSLVIGAVEEFEGIVVKTIGDSVMAEFADTLSAVQAAIAIQVRLLQQNQGRPKEEQLHIRIGVHSGIGFRRGNDLFGDAVNVAARITKHAGQAQILVSQSVRQELAPANIYCAALGKINLEGKAEAEELYEIIWTDQPSYQSLRSSATPPSAPIPATKNSPAWISVRTSAIMAALSHVSNAAWIAAAVLLVTGLFAAGTFSSRPANPVQASVQAEPQTTAEQAAFGIAESLNTEAAWTAFMDRYRNGQLVPAATDRLQKLRSQTAISTTAGEKQNVALVPAAVVSAPKSDPVSRTEKVQPTPSSSPSIPPADVSQRNRLRDLINTVFVPGGVFMMGSDNGKGDVKPRHQVRLDPFYMSRSEITNRQYLAFLDDTGYQRPKDPRFSRNYLLEHPEHPVVNVSYHDAVEFCNWASTKFNAAVGLPTEAEWEYAARSGRSDGLYPWGTDSPAKMARYEDNAPRELATVSGSAFPANDFGLSNMSGNVSEWVLDFYSRDYYTTSPIRNPAGPAAGTKRVVRGGSWADGESELQVSHRDSRDPKERSEETGFRVVIKPGPRK